MRTVRAQGATNHEHESCTMNNHINVTTHTGATTRTAPSEFTQDDIDRIEKTISGAPVPARPLTTADVLAALAPALRNARDKGHSLGGLVQLCAVQGLHVSERAISRAISTARASKPTRKKTASVAA